MLKLVMTLNYDPTTSEASVAELLKNSNVPSPLPLHTESLKITSAVALTEEEAQQIVELMMKRLNKPLGDVQLIVDESLLTGVSIQTDSFYFEISGRKTLRELKKALKGNN